MKIKAFIVVGVRRYYICERTEALVYVQIKPHLEVGRVATTA